MSDLCNRPHSQFQNISITLERNRVPSNSDSVFPRISPALGNHWSILSLSIWLFCLYQFGYSGHFIEIESYNKWPFFSFFHLPFSVSLTLWSVLGSFLWLNNTPLYVNTTSVYPFIIIGHWDCFSIVPIINNAAVNVGVLSFHVDLYFHFSWVCIPRSRISGSQKKKVITFWGMVRHSQSSCTILYSHYLLFPSQHNMWGY